MRFSPISPARVFAPPQLYANPREFSAARKFFWRQNQAEKPANSPPQAGGGFGAAADCRQKTGLDGGAFYGKMKMLARNRMP
ncbi:MAG: hypothetical protein ACR2P5_04655 [Gammaproteobacteria bacterium]